MTEPIKKPLLNRVAYYADAQSWSDDVIKRARWRTKLSYIMAATGVGVGVLGLLAALRLAQPVAPDLRLVMIDKSTGWVSEARKLEAGSITQDESVTTSNLVRYVTARETIDISDIDKNYQFVKLFSADQAGASYDDLWNRTSVNSIAGKYPAGTLIAVTIKNVSFLSGSSALVRFFTDESPPGSSAINRHHWAVVLSFRYVSVAASNAFRFINPLGMQITSYRRDAEAVQDVLASNKGVIK